MNFETFKNDIREAMTNAGLVEAPAIATYNDAIVDSMPDKSYRLIPKGLKMANELRTLGADPKIASFELGVFFVMRKDYITDEIMNLCSDVAAALDNLTRSSGFDYLEVNAGEFEMLPQGMKYKIDLTISYN